MVRSVPWDSETWRPPNLRNQSRSDYLCKASLPVRSLVSEIPRVICFLALFLPCRDVRRYLRGSTCWSWSRSQACLGARATEHCAFKWRQPTDTYACTYNVFTPISQSSAYRSERDYSEVVVGKLEMQSHRSIQVDWLLAENTSVWRRRSAFC